MKSRQPRAARLSLFDGLDTAARSFLGPADRSDGSLPVIHLHDAAETTADDMLSTIDVFTDSSGHHYGQRKIAVPTNPAPVPTPPHPPLPEPEVG